MFYDISHINVKKEKISIFEFSGETVFFLASTLKVFKVSGKKMKMKDRFSLSSRPFWQHCEFWIITLQFYTGIPFIA